MSDGTQGLLCAFLVFSLFTFFSPFGYRGVCIDKMTGDFSRPVRLPFDDQVNGEGGGVCYAGSVWFDSKESAAAWFEELATGG